MAEHYDPGLLPRTYFRAPRVPFDFRALALGIIGFLVYWVGGLILSEIFWPEDVPEGADYDVPGAFLGWAVHLFGGIPYLGAEIEHLLRGALRIEPGELDRYGFWEILFGGIWFVGVWSFFALGIHRITTMRIARDEGLSLGEALRFSWRNWPAMLLAPVIVAGVIGIFYVCNMAAGALISIPVVGGLLALLLVPLVFVSTLLMVLVGLGGVFGLPLIGAAAAWECNGSLDAISRAFSYLFARPLQYFWNFFLIFLFTGLILLVGSWFTFTFAKSMDAGIWSDTLSLTIDPMPEDRSEGSDWGDLEKEDKELHEKLGGDKTEREAPDIKTPAIDISAVGEVPFSYKLNTLVFWFFLNIIWLGVSGYALYWLIGGATSVYADLRADVDGTEEDEVWVEDEEHDLDEMAEGGPAVEGAAAEAEAEAETDAMPDESDTDTDTDSDSDTEDGDASEDEAEPDEAEGGEDEETDS